MKLQTGNLLLGQLVNTDGNIIAFHIIPVVTHLGVAEIPGKEGSPRHKCCRHALRNAFHAAAAAEFAADAVPEFIRPQIKHFGCHVAEYAVCSLILDISGQQAQLLNGLRHASQSIRAVFIAQQNGDDTVYILRVERNKSTHFFIDPVLPLCIRTGRVFRTDDNEVFGYLQTAFQRIVELINHQVRLIPVNGADTGWFLRIFLAQLAGQLEVVQIVLQFFCKCCILATVADEGKELENAGGGHGDENGHYIDLSKRLADFSGRQPASGPKTAVLFFQERFSTLAYFSQSKYHKHPLLP